nr:outer membrane beta-barrel protein [Chitinophaga polysaccharea]
MLILLLTSKIFSQSIQRIQIIGRISDAQTHEWLPGATISCLSNKDSLRTSITFSSDDGFFTFDSIPLRDYLLHITYIGYHPLLLPVKVPTDKKIINLGTLTLRSKGMALNQVEITETRSPLIVKKDTLEFSAGYFKPRENSSAEELLKKIPGIQIDNNGAIQINGKTVNAITINGRQIFNGEDLKTISRNIQADLIDKIQLIKRKSNMRNTFSLNDGESDDVINLTIKKDKLNSLTGQVSSAFGTSNKFGVKTNLSQFNDQRQILFLGNGDNINGALDASYLGKPGIIRNWETGTSYNTEIGKKFTLNANYLFGDIYLKENNNSSKRTFNGDSSYLYNQHSLSNSQNTYFRAQSQLDYQLDSSSKISFISMITKNKDIYTIINNYDLSRTNANIFNSGTMNNKKKQNTTSIVGTIILEKKLRKPNRQIRLLFNYSRDDKKVTEYNYSQNAFQQKDTQTVSDTINQYNAMPEVTDQLSMLANYIEPLSTTLELTFSLAEDRTERHFNKYSYAFNQIMNSYDIYNDSLSNQFSNKTAKHYGKIGLSQRKNNFDYTLSVGFISGNMNYTNLKTNDKITIATTSLLPSLIFNYRTVNTNNIRFLYMRLMQFPGVNDFTNTIDNSNPLFIKMGNPDLKPTYTDNISLSYDITNASKMRFLSITMSSTFITDQVINSTSMDTAGKQISKSLNSSGAYNIGLNMNSSFPLNRTNATVVINTGATANRNLNYTNGAKGYYKSLNIRQLVSYRYDYKKTLSLSISGSINYNKVNYSQLNMLENTRFSYNILFDGSLNLPGNITFTSALYYSLVTGQTTGYNPSSLVLNTSLSKSILSNKKGLIELKAFDLLNQNLITTRKIGENYIEDSQTDALQRFFIFKLSYFIGKQNK